MWTPLDPPLDPIVDLNDLLMDIEHTCQSEVRKSEMSVDFAGSKKCLKRGIDLEQALTCLHLKLNVASHPWQPL